MYESLLFKTILADSQRLIERHLRYVSRLEDNVRRIERRTGVRPHKNILIPPYWDAAEGFNPFHVRSHAAKISRAIDIAIKRGEYKPFPATLYKVPKGDGEMRDVSVFQVADNAVSKMLFTKLNNKNAARMSGRCYAYRRDVTLHDAVLYISSEFRTKGSIFVAEFDFSKFFDSISHDYIEDLLSQPLILITELEKQIVRAFLKAPTIPYDKYDLTSSHPENNRGIPQGTSISLFLANAVASPLDRKLERLGIGFARYADDTLIWSNKYDEVCRAVEELHEEADKMGVTINLRKSEGISILRDQSQSEKVIEFRSKPVVNFIGYGLRRDCISIKESHVKKIKDRISYLIYSNLLEPIRKNKIIPARFAPNFDRDYLVTIGQIRRYLYGDITEASLGRYLSGVTPNIHYRGLMSFYPIITDEALLKNLDGWLINTLALTIRLRGKELGVYSYTNLPTPHGLATEKLLKLKATTSRGKPIDLSIPSFWRIGRLMTKAAREHGPNMVANPLSGNYYSDEQI